MASDQDSLETESLTIFNVTISIFLFSQTRGYFEMVLKEDGITVETGQGTQITPVNSHVSVVKEKR